MTFKRFKAVPYWSFEVGKWASRNLEDIVHQQPHTQPKVRMRKRMQRGQAAWPRPHSWQAAQLGFHLRLHRECHRLWQPWASSPPPWLSRDGNNDLLLVGLMDKATGAFPGGPQLISQPVLSAELPRVPSLWPVIVQQWHCQTGLEHWFSAPATHWNHPENLKKICALIPTRSFSFEGLSMGIGWSPRQHQSSVSREEGPVT